MSDYETVQGRRNLVVGLFALVALGALIWLIWIFDEFPRKISEYRSFQVIVQFPTAKGVQENTPVRFCGFHIGKVTRVMPPERLVDMNTGLKYHQTKVVLSIDKKYVNIPSNVEIKVMTRGLGSSYIEIEVDPTTPLIPKDPNKPETIYLANGMKMQGSAGMTSEFFPEESQQKLDDLATRLKILLDNANRILGDEDNKKHIKAILANLEEATKQATTTMEEFQKFSIAGVRVTEELSKTITQTHQILEKINNGQGTLGRLVNDGKLYENLLESTYQLEVLIEHFKEFLVESREKGFKIKL